MNPSQVQRYYERALETAALVVIALSLPTWVADLPAAGLTPWVWLAFALPAYWWLMRSAVNQPELRLHPAFVLFAVTAVVWGPLPALILASCWWVAPISVQRRRMAFALHTLSAGLLSAVFAMAPEGIGSASKPDYLWVVLVGALTTWGVQRGLPVLGQVLSGQLKGNTLRLKLLRPLPYFAISTMIAMVLSFIVVQTGSLAWLLMALVLLCMNLYSDSLSRLEQRDELSFRSLIAAIDAKDPFTRGHSERVAELACGIGRALKMQDGELRQLRQAALLHDLGKIGVPEAILTKNGPLTKEEYDQIREHPSIGARTLAGNPEWHHLARVAGEHHERWDGQGYPLGLRGEEIFFWARVVSVADAFDAMTTHRSYRAALTREEALAEVERHAGTQFDPLVAAVFLRWQRAAEERVVPEGQGVPPTAGPGWTAKIAELWAQWLGQDRWLRLVDGSLLIGGLLAVGWAFLNHPTGHLPQTALFLLLVVLMAPFPIRLSERVSIPAAVVVEGAVVLVGHPAQATLAGAAAIIAASIWYRRDLRRTLLNGSVWAGSALITSAIIWQMVGPAPRIYTLPEDLVPLLLGQGVRYLANAAGFVLILKGEASRPFWGTFVGLIRAEGMVGVIPRLLPVLLAVAYPFGAMWVLALGAVITIGYGLGQDAYAVRARLEREALTDGLTGVGNRHAWARWAEEHTPVTRLVAVIDVNGLKRTNDTYGHERGDEILLDLAARLRRVAEAAGGAVFRLGGDEFTVVLPGAGRGGAAHLALEGAVEGFGPHWERLNVAVSASLGVVCCPEEASDLEAAHLAADREMYKRKHSLGSGLRASG